MASTDIDWPMDDNIIRRGSIANTFGRVRRNSAGQVRVHQGWDLRAKVGTPCYAIADGKVALIYDSGDYGKVLVISFQHKGQARYAAYAHLSKVLVEQGEPVQQGQVVCKSGDSGNARGMDDPDQHLHFEIRTVARPGLGLDGRISPREVFGACPLKVVVQRRGLTL